MVSRIAREAETRRPYSKRWDFHPPSPGFLNSKIYLQEVNISDERLRSAPRSKDLPESSSHFGRFAGPGRMATVMEGYLPFQSFFRVSSYDLSTTVLNCWGI